MLDRLLRPARPWAAAPHLLGLFALAPGLACDDGALTVDPSQAQGSARVGGVVDAAGRTAPALRAGLALSDEALAEQALTLLGSGAVGAQGSCSNCHALGRPTLTRWAQLTESFSRACLPAADPPATTSADDMLDCFRAHAAPGAPSAATFGIYAAAAHLPWFSFLFEHAAEYAGRWQAERRDFLARVGMPRAGTPLTQAEFDVVAEWFARGLPLLFELVPEENGEDCTPGLDPRLLEHVEQMAGRGWRARNEELPLLMFGCEDGESGAECLDGLQLARDASFGQTWDAPGSARIRVLHDNSAARSAYWTRSSPDGRYVASGLRSRAASGYYGQFVDLARGEVIAADFSYDPTFFPDGSGFLMQRKGSGSSDAEPADGAAAANDLAIVCNQSVLSDAESEITGTEDGCITLEGQIGLYQQLAKSLDGDDYWVIFGSYDGDDGGSRPVRQNPSAAFEARSSMTLVPMINRGDGFEAAAPSRVATPLQGDPMLSPSGRLLVTRVKGAERTGRVGDRDVVTAEQSGYALHLLTTSRTGARWDVELTDVGRICAQGGKAVVSYDERWLLFHHYVTDADAVELGFTGPDDPLFREYRELGASNLQLVDLSSGASRTITRMGPGQYALFPHFRSDGWIYFVVRTLSGDEYFAASDAAVLLDDVAGE